MPKQTNTTEIVPYNGTGDILEKVNLPESSKLIVMGSAQRIVNCSSRMALLEKEMRAIQNEIAESAQTKKLKEYKRQYKQLRSLHNESVNHFNGAYEMALAEVPGKNLTEKMKYLEGR